MRRPIEFADFPRDLDPGFGPFRGIVRHIVDGDTVDILIDCGFGIYAYIVGRLDGIDCPETNRAASREAGLAAKARMDALVPIGTPVRVRTRPDPDSFGRYLVTLETATERDVGARLIEEGYAVPWTRKDRL